MTEDLKREALAFLREELNPDLTCELHLEKTFETHPLKEPGVSALFSFHPVPDSTQKLFVFAGNVLPMIYPDYGLSMDDLWAVHIGMEYFIKMKVTEETDRKSAIFLTYLKMVATVFQEQLYIAKPDTMKIEKIFIVGDQKHVVGSATFNEKKYSWIVGDITHFVYKKELPPQVTWALHMGRLLLT